MLTILDQNYTVRFSLLPEIQPGKVYHWNDLLDVSIANDVLTLSSKQNFFIYSADGKLKLVDAAADLNKPDLITNPFNLACVEVN
jgi:hypothetical protein